MFDPQISKYVLPLGRMDGSRRITLLGTCFSVTGEKFATAAHVVGPNDTGLVAVIHRAGMLSEYQDTTDANVGTLGLKLSAYDPISDVAILERLDIVSSKALPFEIGGADDVLPGAPVNAFGYPHADHGRLVLTLQSSMVGARVLLGVAAAKIKHLVLNTQTRPGQSGGPVFNSDGTKVCAIITGGYSPNGSNGGLSIGGVDPQTLHQTTHAVSAEYIAGLIS